MSQHSIQCYVCPEAAVNTQKIHECESFYITRRKYGRGFQYLLPDNSKVTERKLLKRVKAMAIPPMWQDVQISQCELSKLQAFGYDQRQRKQYIYHEQWELQRQAAKFARLPRFAAILPDIRQRYISDIQSSGWDYYKSCALAVMLLDRTGIRIGNKAYQQENGTVGLTTLRRKHLEEHDSGLSFHFTGKHGKERHVKITDPAASQLVGESAARPGYPVLRYKNQGQWQDLLSDDVNQYLSEITQMDISAKDFRTWTGTRLAIQMGHLAAQQVEAHPRRKFTSSLVKLVAKALGNTPAICEKYYIHPAVLAAVEQEFIKHGAIGSYPDSNDWLSAPLTACEKAALKFM